MIIKNDNIVHDRHTEKELRSFFDVVVVKDNGCFCIKNHKDKDSIWKYFAILSFASSNTDGTDAEYDCFWFGEGPSGTLRECRHSYFGNSPSEIDGYVFYLNRAVMNDAFDFLSEYYDMGK